MILDRLIGGGDDDILSNAGGEGTGGPWPFSTPLIDGGAGNDTLRSGDEDALLVGGRTTTCCSAGRTMATRSRATAATTSSMAALATTTSTAATSSTSSAATAATTRSTADDDLVDLVFGGAGFDEAAIDRLVDGDPVRDVTISVELLT